MKLFLINFYQTSLHKWWVFWYLLRICFALLRRGIVHDLSKYSKEEEPYFRRAISKLKDTTYGSPEYKANLDAIRPAIDHHQQNNSHHPEFYKDGIMGMSLLDEVEMLADWKAAGLRHKDGDIYKSIYKNAERFRYGPEKISSYERTIEEAIE